MSEIIHVEDETVLSEAISSDRAVIYKHSHRCWISSRAMREIDQFHADHPDVPIYQIDVVGARGLSMQAANLLNVPHASPQVIVLRDGKPTWVATHGSVRAKALAKTAVASSE